MNAVELNPAHESRVRSVHAADADRAGVRTRCARTPATSTSGGSSTWPIPRSASATSRSYADIGYQDYNGLLLNSRLDLGTNVNLNANYTLSKCKGLPTPDSAAAC